MSRRRTSPSPPPSPGPGTGRGARRARREAATASRRTTRRALAAAGVVVGVAVLGGWWWSGPGRLEARAAAAAKAGDWPEALRAWRGVNASRRARGKTYLAEARAALALGRAADAERALEKAAAAGPGDPEPWRLWLEILRLEDRPLEAQAVGWAAYAAVRPVARRGVLEDLTLALLADLGDDVANPALARWAGAGGEPGGDPNALAALYRRLAAMPRAGDLPRDQRIAELSAILERSPAHLDAREALVAALADAGEPDLGREALDAWPGPEGGRDARYWRLRGRWDLDFDHNPARAVVAFRTALDDLPHDWKTRFRLARALHALGRESEARAEAEAVGRVRELLEPARLGRRLAADFERRDEPAALADLADLCARAGFSRLADAWRGEAEAARSGLRF